jgi:hypothetical protein
LLAKKLSGCSQVSSKTDDLCESHEKKEGESIKMDMIRALGRSYVTLAMNDRITYETQLSHVKQIVGSNKFIKTDQDNLFQSIMYISEAKIHVLNGSFEQVRETLLNPIGNCRKNHRQTSFELSETLLQSSNLYESMNDLDLSSKSIQEALRVRIHC